ncbi:universal stress protein [Flaviramulus aquimarinus]|uniref:Universal stress protein n=1 Tax=Flaviramulus aquimarinus TaxID=1170456 RepID=A0ABP9FM37_9FLAO
MKILIPTDFSQLSKIAIQYAIGLSKDFELDLILLHIINTNTPAMARIGSKKLGEAIKTSSERDMNELLKKIKNESSHNLKISAKIIFGVSIEKAVESFALKNNINIICIGTKGATGLKKMIFGSNAAGIIANSSIPVITIPKYAQYKGINNIVYSSDLENLEEELKLLIPFAKLMNTWINILHIINKQENFDVDLQFQENRLRTLFSYEKIKTKELENDSIIKGINQYVEDIDADMVAMFTRRTALFEKLFHKSVTKSAAFQTKTPLLTFQKE